MDDSRQFMNDGSWMMNNNYGDGYGWWTTVHGRWRMMNGGECQSLAEYLAVNETMKRAIMPVIYGETC